jgi:glycosyltransferase involved in cell wall biosynthesis
MTADIVVASDWMLKNVQATPLFQSERIRVHHIPFGIDLEHFNSEESSLSKKQFSIPENNVVLTFRAEGEFKGVPYILEALEKLQVTEPVTLLTVGKKGVVDKYSNKFQVIELGWTNDDSLLAAALKATDIFLMPSTAETFGVMAIEAMACGKPVICFDGTALPGVIDAPNVGISVPMRDADALSHAIAHLIRSPQERLARGVASRQRAETVFSLQTHVQRISDLYREVISRCA